MFRPLRRGFEGVDRARSASTVAAKDYMERLWSLGLIACRHCSSRSQSLCEQRTQSRRSACQNPTTTGCGIFYPNRYSHRTTLNHGALSTPLSVLTLTTLLSSRSLKRCLLL